MSKGFATQIAQNPKESVADAPRVQNLQEIQEQLLSYVEGIKDPAFAGEQKLVLGQIKVEDKSNEITAIPALLNLLDIQGAVITITRAMVRSSNYCCD